MRSFKFYIMALLLILSCKENKKENSDPLIWPKISFADQRELKIEEKYFTTDIDSFNVSGEPFYRYDINSYQLFRFWIRYYNDMYEVRFTNHYHDDWGYNYIFGIKNIRSKKNSNPIGTEKAFYIRWKNEIPRDSMRTGFGHGTSDICKYTVHLQTNLPKEIIQNYYPDIKCPIEYKFQARAIIKLLNVGDIFRSQNYSPFK